jgi:hypothetical protein
VTDPVFEVFNEAVKHKGNLTSQRDTDIILAQILISLRNIEKALGGKHDQPSNVRGQGNQNPKARDDKKR